MSAWSPRRGLSIGIGNGTDHGAQDRKELRADIDVDPMAELCSRPSGFRLLAIKTELSLKFADDIIDTVMSGGADVQAYGPSAGRRPRRQADNHPVPQRRKAPCRSALPK